MAAALNGSGCKNNQPAVAAAVVAWRQRKMEVAAKKNNQLEVAAAVVAWRQRKMQHPAQAFLKNNKSF